MSRVRRWRPNSKTRRGAILAAVLATLFVASLIGLALVQLTLVQHRQRGVAAQRQQCFWLAESGAARAQARLAAAADYAGETWTVPAEALGGTRPATVAIRVEAAAPAEGRRIVVAATYPDDPVRRIVVQRELIVNVPVTGGSP